ncbi:YHYH protein [Hydrogenophaga sp. PAMC20947]|uniref:YHYH protein n=1 Tax=Hydrogenophaga sp. PAMC20947 TaxID=2565558 RepID=UPI00109E3366|nr:YHYH protein [Hydrogenophaga sp. PAMC20947]QCB47053.1 YHYH protein [Hydrogenophaga sp. PAMC20947]
MKTLYRKACAKGAIAVALAASFGVASGGVDMTRISKDALVKAPETVDCTLENGAATQCVKWVVRYQPKNLKTGPFCPETLTDEGGIWNWDGEQPGLYRIDEQFLTMLETQGYKFYDADGKVHITDPRTAQPAGNNSCLSASVDTSVEMTVLLPVSPVKAAKPTGLGTVAKVGLALDGVPIFADAPSVLKTGHMPALDTCGGHVDPGGWYHWHATSTDINTVFEHDHVDASCALAQKADALFAYAFDGYAIYGSVDSDGKVPSNLDACNGHTGPTREVPDGAYHYHASLKFPNLPTCLSGVVAKNNFSTNAKQGIGAPGAPGGPGAGGPGQGTPPGFDAAAKRLGVSQTDLLSAVRKNGGRQLDTAAAAKDLGVTEAALNAALPRPPGQ